MLQSRRALPPDRRAARLVAATPPATSLPVPTADLTGLDALGRVLAAYGPERLLGHGDARESDRALRAAARRLAAEARVQDPARAERLLIELKRSWPALPSLAELRDPIHRRALWDRVVLLCVEEFYAPARPSAAS
jgi:hypothetical protein